ncbi:MAG: hypothetical protein KUG82_01650 [Pseudomonadales bacterium]|nr:hypothetical protein [Pseudomonadales bacterium]
MPKTKIKMHLTQTAATRLYFDNEDNKLKIQKLEDLVEKLGHEIIQIAKLSMSPPLFSSALELIEAVKIRDRVMKSDGLKKN